MAFYVKDSGTWKEVGSNSFYVKHNGSWEIVSEAYVKDAGVWKQYFINEIAVTLANSTNVSIESQFDSAVWTSTTPKRITIPSGVTIGGTGGTAAMTIASNMAGSLTIVNAGSVIGTGGSANGGAGGHAINNAASNVTINNTGSLLAGGGGGGQGGQGGGGQSSSTSSYNYSGSYNWRIRWGPYPHPRFLDIRAGGSGDAVSFNYGSDLTNVTSYSIYQRGTFNSQIVDPFAGTVSQKNYGLIVSSTANTSGGSGGAGGVGQGYNQTNTSGSSGSSGGTNAGTGGSGASGAAYGVAGSSGSSGANGNRTNGSSGSSGGAAGAAVTGTSVTMNNTGTIAGAVA